MKKLTLTFSLLLVAAATFAQSFYAARRERSLILTGGTGVSTYYGELANPGEYLKANLNLNAGDTRILALQYFSILNKLKRLLIIRIQNIHKYQLNINSQIDIFSTS